MLAIVKNFYLHSNCDVLIRRIVNSGFKVKYDYDDFNLLVSYYDISERIANSSFSQDIINGEVINESFVSFFMHILEKINNPELTSFYSELFSRNLFKEVKHLSLEECRACVLFVDGKMVPKILIPFDAPQTPYFYSIEAHEHGHLAQLLQRNDEDTYEYSEVISMYFEYLVYKEIYGEEKGYEVFINNKKNFLSNVAYDLKSYLTDYFDSENDNDVSSEKIKPFIVNCVSFFESFEYVLHLIEIDKRDPSAVSHLISRVINKDETLDSFSEKNDFSTFLCKKMVKEFKL